MDTHSGRSIVRAAGSAGVAGTRRRAALGLRSGSGDANGRAHRLSCRWATSHARSRQRRLALQAGSGGQPVHARSGDHGGGSRRVHASGESISGRHERVSIRRPADRLLLRLPDGQHPDDPQLEPDHRSRGDPGGESPGRPLLARVPRLCAHVSVADPNGREQHPGDHVRAGPGRLPGVANAFHVYMDQYNHGRGIVFIGHSQGAWHVEALLAKEIDQDSSKRRLLVSALLFGGNVAVPKGAVVGGDFANIPACTAEGQIGCIVAYSTFNAAPPPDAWFGTMASRVNPVMSREYVVRPADPVHEPRQPRRRDGRAPALLPDGGARVPRSLEDSRT